MAVCNFCAQIQNCNASLLDRGYYQTQVVRILCQILAEASAAGALGDWEILILHDNNAGVYTPFLRLVTIDTLGNKTVQDFTLNAVTPYVVTGTVVADVPVTVTLSVVEATYNPLATVAFGSIAAGYTIVLTPTLPLKSALFWNDTDQPVIISFDNATSHIFIPAKASVSYEWASANSKETSAIYQKRGGSAPASGNLYVMTLE